MNDLFDVNNEVVALSDILNAMPKDISWSKRVIDTENNSMTIICQMPGEGNRRHHHPDWNEWWYIVEGEWEWEIEGEIKMITEGDIVFMKKNITTSQKQKHVFQKVLKTVYPTKNRCFFKEKHEIFQVIFSSNFYLVGL